MSEQIKDGGPAFPHDDRAKAYGREGMALRDYFAAKAMGAIIHLVVEVDGTMTRHAVDAVTEGAYVVADAMLRARENL
jgi:hypothetical protein